MMKITYDATKNQANIAKHGLDFEDVYYLDWHLAQVRTDERRDYGEVRYIAAAPLCGRLHIVCFTLKDDALRIISFRKANHREVKYYEQQSFNR